MLIDNPTEVIKISLPDYCGACGLGRNQEPNILSVRRQVFDIPPPKPHVTEYRLLQCQCTCGQVHKSSFPAHVTNSTQYGPNVTAYAVHLTQHHMLSYSRAAELINAMYGLTISVATLTSMVNNTARILAPTIEKMGQEMIHLECLGADETGLRVNKKLNWVHTVSHLLATWLGVHEKRGIEAIKDFQILEYFKGVLTHDFYSPYHKLELKHAMCIAHLIRELRSVSESKKDPWALQLIKLLTQANEVMKSSENRVLTQAQFKELEEKYCELVSEGARLHPIQEKIKPKRGRAAQSVATNLLKRFGGYKDDILRFAYDSAADFTNNISERSLRMVRVKENNSGCFRTKKGAESFCIIRSYLATMNKQGANTYATLVHAMQGNIRQPKFA